MVQFKGRCNSCGKYGHKGVDCRNKTNKPGQKNSGGNYGNNGNTSRGFKGNCNYCQKYGHKASDCFKKKNKEGGEQAGNATDTKADEFVLLVFDDEDLVNGLQ